MGIRRSNGRLVLTRIEYRRGLAPGKPGRVKSEYFRLWTTARLEQYRYRPTRPEIVDFE